MIGRSDELALLERQYGQKNSSLVVSYGRRRVGKSYLISHFVKTRPHFSFEATEGLSAQDQIYEFSKALSDCFGDVLPLKVRFEHWSDIFDYLSMRLKQRKGKKRFVVVFDEFQWMAQGRGGLVSILKKFWDTEWKSLNIMLILCGSVASFMVGRVLKSTALYGRTTLELKVRPLKISESFLFFPKTRSQNEIYNYLIVFGTIPKYLEMLDHSRSFQINLENTCFKPDGIWLDEFERVFCSQFKKASHYTRIVRALAQKKLSLEGLSVLTRVPSGGGLKRYLNHLVDADFISEEFQVLRGSSAKNRKYYLSDPFLRFYFSFIEPNHSRIKKAGFVGLSGQILSIGYESFRGLAFENLIKSHALEFAQKFNFATLVKDWGGLHRAGGAGYQFDLAFLRTDGVLVLCEIKWSRHPINKSVIVDFEQKLSRLGALKLGSLKNISIEKALISFNTISASVKNSKYFDYTYELAARRVKIWG